MIANGLNASGLRLLELHWSAGLSIVQGHDRQVSPLVARRARRRINDLANWPHRIDYRPTGRIHQAKSSHPITPSQQCVAVDGIHPYSGFRAIQKIATIHASSSASGHLSREECNEQA